MKTRSYFVSNSSSPSVILMDGTGDAVSILRSLGSGLQGRKASKEDFSRALMALACAWEDRRIAQRELELNGIRTLSQIRDGFDRRIFRDAIVRSWKAAEDSCLPLVLSQEVKDAVELSVSEASVAGDGWKKLVRSAGSFAAISKAVERQASSFDPSLWTAYESSSHDVPSEKGDGRLVKLFSALRSSGATVFWSENS